MKLDDKYDERHRFWTDQAINQFGSTTNLFFIANMAFFAYLIDGNQTLGAFKIDFSLPFNCSKIIFAFSIISSLFSLFAGGVTVLSRLHDLRLTRHTIWVRKRNYEVNKTYFPDDHVDLSRDSLFLLLKNFWTTVTKKYYFIHDPELKDKKKLNQKFIELRKRNLRLGKLSWKSLNLQITTLVLGLILYAISNVV